MEKLLLEQRLEEYFGNFGDRVYQEDVVNMGLEQIFGKYKSQEVIGDMAALRREIKKKLTGIRKGIQVFIRQDVEKGARYDASELIMAILKRKESYDLKQAFFTALPSYMSGDDKLRIMMLFTLSEASEMFTRESELVGNVRVGYGVHVDGFHDEYRPIVDELIGLGKIGAENISFDTGNNQELANIVYCHGDINLALLATDELLELPIVRRLNEVKDRFQNRRMSPDRVYALFKYIMKVG